MASIEAVQRRRDFRAMRSAAKSAVVSGVRPVERVAMQINFGKEDTRYLRVMRRLYDRYRKWHRKQIIIMRKLEHTDNWRLLASSFDLWMLNHCSGLVVPEPTNPTDEQLRHFLEWFSKTNRWWIDMHPFNQFEVLQLRHKRR
jgi:hypothetical protein